MFLHCCSQYAMNNAFQELLRDCSAFSHSLSIPRPIQLQLLISYISRSAFQQSAQRMLEQVDPFN